MRILIVKMSSMGDVVHALPLATDVRTAFPEAEIAWVVERPFAAIARLNPAVDAVIPIAWRRWRKRLGSAEIRAEMRSFHEALTAERFDAVLDCQGLVKSAIVARLAPADRRAGPGWAFAREPLASLAYDVRAVVPWDWHVVRRNRAIGATAFGYRVDDPPRFGLAVQPLERVEAEWLPPGPHAVLVTGASRPQKLWPEPHWRSVAARLRAAGLACVWLWGSDDERQRAERFAAEAGGVVPPFLSVADAARLLAGAVIVVGLDTGFTHLAGALGRPTIGLFCDFDAVQCAVTGSGFCASFGGVGRIPDVSDVTGAIDRALIAA